MLTNQIKRFAARLANVKDRLLKIPAVQLMFRTVVAFGNHDSGHIAAGVAYYAVLSIFPLLLGLIALFGLFLLSVDVQNQLLDFVSNNLPGATAIMKENIMSIVRLRGTLGLVSLVGLFWSASAMFGAVNLAINRAWDVRKSRPFYIGKAREIGMAFGTGLLFLLSLGASAIISILRRVINFSAVDLTILDMGSRLVAFLLILAVFLLLYKFNPNTKTYWSHIWPGALLAAVLFEIARTSLFTFYLNNFAGYQLIYGSIASIIVLLVWIYYSAFIMILGAEFTYQYGRMRYPVTTGSGTEK